MSKVKTNAMRWLDQHKIGYDVLAYEVKDGAVDGISVAAKVGRPVEVVFKTLVTRGASKAIYVFVIPVAKELDLKKAAKAVNEEKIELIAVNEINKLTGYIRGGCSPIGMKKSYPTLIDSTAMALPTFIVSAGKIGFQLELDPQVLSRLLDAQFLEVTVED